MQGSAADRNPLDNLAEEFAIRVRCGDRRSISEYVDRHPELSEDILKVFLAILLMERFKPDDDEPRTTAAQPASLARLPLPEGLGNFRILQFVAEGDMRYAYEAKLELDWELPRYPSTRHAPEEGSRHLLIDVSY